MSQSHTARRTVAVVLATAGLVGSAATTASAHTSPRHAPRVEITDVDPGHAGRHHHGSVGTVTLTNEGHRGVSLNRWSLCDQSWNCTTIRHVYLKPHDDVTIKMRDLDRKDRWVFLFNDHGRLVDVARVPHHHHN